jgi:hypothetical protein
MSDNYKIYVDAERPATLNNGAGASTDWATLREAVLAWQQLSPGQKIRATVKVIGGPVYTAQEIERSLASDHTGAVAARPSRPHSRPNRLHLGSDGNVGDHDHLPRWIAASLHGVERRRSAEGQNHRDGGRRKNNQGEDRRL